MTPDRIEGPPNPMTALLVFSHVRWDFVYQRPQHLMSRLASSYRVIFVEEPVRSAGPPRLQRRRIAPNLEVVCAHTAVDAEGFQDPQLPLLKKLLTGMLHAEGIDDYIVWFQTAMPCPLLLHLRPRAIIYDCMDELCAFADAPAQLPAREQALLKVADLVLTDGAALFEAKRCQHDNVQCVLSCVDVRHFAPASLRRDSAQAREAARLQPATAQPRLGYLGEIDERIDLGLLATLADAHPNWQIMMVGPVVKIDPSRLPIRPNIHWLGIRPYALLPHLVAGWDVCLMPYALKASTRCVSPIKTLEYMAAERPIVSTAVRDVAVLHGDVVRIAADHAAFVAACEQMLAESRAESYARIAHTLTCLSGVSWDRSVAKLKELLATVVRRPELRGA